MSSEYLLPKEYVTAMKVLYDQAPQSDTEELKSVIREDLGKQVVFSFYVLVSFLDHGATFFLNLVVQKQSVNRLSKTATTIWKWGGQILRFHTASSQYMTKLVTVHHPNNTPLLLSS